MKWNGLGLKASRSQMRHQLQKPRTAKRRRKQKSISLRLRAPFWGRRVCRSRDYSSLFSPPNQLLKKNFNSFTISTVWKRNLPSSGSICRVYAKSDLFKFSLRLCSLWLFACILRVITREEKTKSEKLGKSLKSDVPRSHWQIKDENRQHNDSAICCEKVFVSRFKNRSVRSVRRFGTVWGWGLIEKRYLPFYFRVSVFNMR